VALKARKVKRCQSRLLITAIFRKEGQANKNLKKSALENKQPIKNGIHKAVFEQKSNIPLESQVVSLVLEKTIYRGLAKNDSKLRHGCLLFAT